MFYEKLPKGISRNVARIHYKLGSKKRCSVSKEYPTNYAVCNNNIDIVVISKSTHSKKICLIILDIILFSKTWKLLELQK